MTILCLETCTTCRRARKWLDDRGVEYTVRPIREQHPSYEELHDWLKKSGLPIRRFFNTTGVMYRELGLKDKIDTMSEDELLKLLAGDGMLVKRPLLVSEKAVIPGFNEKTWEKAL